MLWVGCIIILRLAAMASADYVVIVSPEEGVAVIRGTDIMVAYKVDEEFLLKPLKGSCLIVTRTLPSPIEDPFQSCVEDHTTFSITPSENGVYSVTVEVWTSDGEHVEVHKSRSHSVIVSDSAPLDAKR